jgi:hypothetical protein
MIASLIEGGEWGGDKAQESVTDLFTAIIFNYIDPINLM